ncbi:MAG: PcfJ domain-containing protein [Bernardetiaceae bacterium]|jgi:hypothetical protein|nr:PcfJ domain-containing protein [Bernardetiaceae bacterium]
MGNLNHTPRHERVTTKQKREQALALALAALRKHRRPVPKHRYQRLASAEREAKWAAFAQKFDGYLLRDPAAWKRRGRTQASLTHHFVRYAFARYHVPRFLDQAWQDQTPYLAEADGRPTPSQLLFIHLAQGGSVLTAPYQPVRLTKRMAHWFMQAPAYYTIDQAFCFAQVMGLGGDENLAWWVIQSSLGQQGSRIDDFWLTVVALFARQTMFDNSYLPDIVEYIHHRKFERTVERDGRAQGPPQPDFSMKGRTALALLRQTQAWKAENDRVNWVDPGQLAWRPSAVPGGEYWGLHDGQGAIYNFSELLDGQQLRAEGKAMKHCVFTYARGCYFGYTAIFSLTAATNQQPGKRVATLEVDLHDRTIVQVRGKCNQRPAPEAESVIRQWANEQKIKLSKRAF